MTKSSFSFSTLWFFEFKEECREDVKNHQKEIAPRRFFVRVIRLDVCWSCGMCASINLLFPNKKARLNPLCHVNILKAYCCFYVSAFRAFRLLGNVTRRSLRSLRKQMFGFHCSCDELHQTY